MIDDTGLITAGEAARIAGVKIQRIHELANAKRIGQKVAGRFWVFTRAEIEAYRDGPKNKGGRPKKQTPASVS